MTDVAPATRNWRVIRAGQVAYEAAWAWQRDLAAARSAGHGGDTLLLLEHPPTITLGRNADTRHILAAHDDLARHGIAVVQTNRGGDVTYHAPGQLVGYPIVKLSGYGCGVVGYVRRLEDAVIDVLATYGLGAFRIAGLTGVWLDTPQGAAKIAAIGVHVSAGGVTTHGFALNVDPDMAGFAHIVPCGIADRPVTSLATVLGSAPPMQEVTQRVLSSLQAQFAITCEE